MGIRLIEARLVVSGIELVGFHGQNAEEHRRGNRFRIDLVMEGGVESALTSDVLAETIDYSAVVAVIREVNEARHHLLVESFADAIANALFASFPPVAKLSVRVMKLDPPGLCGVHSAGIELIKERE